MVKVARVLWSVLLLGACTSAPINFADTRPVPADRVYATAMLAPSGAATAVAHVARASTQYRGACSFDFVVDDVRVARFFPGEGLTIHLQPGSRRLRLDSGGMICEIFSQGLTVEVLPAQVLHVQMGLDEGRPVIQAR
jgi:hypothetical protein